MIHVTSQGTKYTCKNADITSVGELYRVAMNDVIRIDDHSVHAEMIELAVEEAPMFEPTQNNYARLRAPAPKPKF